MFEQGPANQPPFEVDPGIAGSTGADQASQQHKGGGRPTLRPTGASSNLSIRSWLIE